MNICITRVLFLFQAVRNILKTECKCHGVSGSCITRTCWRTLGPFRHVGHILKRRLRSSVKVLRSNDGHSFVPHSKTAKPPDKLDLVFSESSPNFCIENKTTGSLGTYGRQCFTNTTTSESCSNLCCGRGFVTHEFTKTEKCNCTYHHCCYVECNTCVLKSSVHHCI